jgi:hypothetical protein
VRKTMCARLCGDTEPLTSGSGRLVVELVMMIPLVVLLDGRD